MRENILIDKSIDFAARILKLQKHLIKDKKETIISKQIVRSATSIGANINEANYGQSKADMLSKFEIALKECSETEGWLQLLFNTNGINEEIYKKYRNLCGRIRRMLISSCKTLKESLK